MKNSLFFLLLFTATVSAQDIDYNTKKGFMANGYDVVAYFSNQALKGGKDFETTYDGIDYRFYSEENLNTFLKNPEKYVPQYGGYCAYAVALKSDKVSIDPETFLIEDGKLYLFYNAWGTNTLELWNKKDTHKLQKEADDNWKKIKFKK
ncbi:YHS domain-containing (seleno)protein [Flavisericum labens]|uniref:YHS domain-containing (seleno)protein n=1 Tax=Flavisericum labens TaxID=3377112 RepID=UPI00387B95D1